MKLSGSPLKIEFLRKKLKLVTQTMDEQGVDMWLTFTREGNEDPYGTGIITDVLMKPYPAG